MPKRSRDELLERCVSTIRCLIHDFCKTKFITGDDEYFQKRANGILFRKKECERLSVDDLNHIYQKLISRPSVLVECLQESEKKFNGAIELVNMTFKEAGFGADKLRNPLELIDSLKTLIKLQSDPREFGWGFFDDEGRNFTPLWPEKDICEDGLRTVSP